MPIYHPGVFDVADEAQAKSIILTNEGAGADTDTRWAQETPYALELITASLSPHADMLVLDYGCGIGRMAKAMIDASGCSVIGVDISASMRRLAHDYVASDRFLALAPSQFDRLVQAGLRIDAAIAVWVLQHCLAPAEDIARIHRAAVPHGGVFVLNMPKRAIPAVVDRPSGARQFAWASDTIDVASLLRARFQVVADGVPDTTRTPTMADVGAFWMQLRRDPD